MAGVDTLGWASQDEVVAALQAAGAPPPITLHPEPMLGSRAIRVGLSAGVDWLLRFVPDTPFRSVVHAQLAHLLVRDHAGLPLPSRLVVLRWDLPTPALAHPWCAGRPGVVCGVEQVARGIGAVIGALREVQVERRATMATVSGFLPRATRWSDEVVGGALRDDAAARAAGFDLGPVQEQLIQLLVERSAALLPPGRAVLVHGGLDPRRLWFDEAGHLVAVLGWDRACLGDPEQDWATVLPSPWLGEICEAAGREQVAAMVEQPGSVERLEAHAARLLVGRLAELSLWDSRSGHAVEVVGRVAEALLAGELGRRLHEALAGSVTHPRGLPPDRGAAALRRALGVLTHQPHPARSEDFLCTLASALLASRHPNHAEALLHHAEQALERLGPQAGLGPRTTAVGWEGWRLRTAGLVLDDLRSGARPLGQVLVSLWLGSLAVESLGHEVSPSALHALEEHLVCMVALRPAVEASMAEEDEHLVAMQSVLHGLLLLGGLRWLDSTGVLGPGALVDDLARADEVVRSGARTLELEALEAEDASLELALSSLAAAAELAGEQRMLPALLLALSSLEPEVQAVVPAVVLVRLVGL